MQFFLFLRTAFKHPRWAAEVWRAGQGVLRGEHNSESFENALKIAARRHNVDYHKFAE